MIESDGCIYKLASVYFQNSNRKEIFLLLLLLFFSILSVKKNNKFAITKAWDIECRKEGGKYAEILDNGNANSDKKELDDFLDGNFSFLWKMEDRISVAHKSGGGAKSRITFKNGTIMYIYYIYMQWMLFFFICWAFSYLKRKMEFDIFQT